ncbi:MAG TPA: YeeE/YedE thiosulfate transporter family protein [Ferruginibacter sp.]|nr:YeeE/YedE thiosulfate transporter family protein [Ferruginibacter sp.]HRO06048.1 YeeE/YedE thiosulfate transporter family protein [Ferruginibacter sp.]HRO95698.1 YeeE/YedE thiosulfate transporter family protein [Ferruginibacter sp.]HRP49293.1 YeeE/YedE thiosulfate transporter family protein [Ferruginibacter sp.]
MLEMLKQPWPWYVAGAGIGLIVPALLLLGNKHFGLSANFRHVCASCFPGNVKFFKYEWKKEIWNFVFVIGIIGGAFIATTLLADPNPVVVNPNLEASLKGYGITDYSSMVPKDIFSWEHLFTLRGLIMLVGGGFLVGFGSRYAGGCTSGHSIMGLSNLQWPSLVATMAFMVGGILMANFILPYILNL